MTNCLTRPASKLLNGSLKSKLTNIESLDLGVVNDQIPRGVDSSLRGLGLPEA